MIKHLLFAGLCALTLPVWADGLLHHTTPDTLMKVDDAFRLLPLEHEGNTLRISWEVAPRHYLYRERLAFAALDPKGAQLPKPVLPKGETHHDDHFGDVHVYRNMTLTATFKLPASGKIPRRIQVRYQGCADAGICYPPQTRILDITGAVSTP
jgi:thiol:disulfide interchange protein